MAVGLSVKAQSLLKETTISPQIILDIDGVDLIFGAQPVFRTLNWDLGDAPENNTEALWDNNLFWDGEIVAGNSVDWISLSGTTTSITQQIQPDKGSTSSISTVNIAIVDKDGKVSEALSFNKIEEILGKKCTFAIGFSKGRYPEDCQAIFRGIIVDYYSDAGTVMVSVASSESLKRQVFLPQFQTELTSPIKYKELLVENILYKQRLSESGEASIQYVAGGSLSTIYNRVTGILTVTVPPGTTADQIDEEIRFTASAFYAFDTEIIGDGATVQSQNIPLTQVETDTVLNVTSTIGIFESRDSLATYVRVEDEIMEVLSFTDTTIEVSRGDLSSLADRHENEEELSTFYRLQGKPLDLARKIMLSDEENSFFISDDVPKSIEFISITESLNNAVIFDYYDIKEKTGLTIGDTIKLDYGANVSEYTIKEFGTLENGDSYIVTQEDLSLEEDYQGPFSYRSKWNVLSTGLSMLTNEIDLDQFDQISNAFGSNFAEYDFYIKETIDSAKDFIDTECYFPQGLYGIPRKARTSVKYVVPPFTSEVVPTVNTQTITNIEKIKQRRSTHKYLYNTFIYRYNQDSVEDKFLTGKIISSEKSSNRIKTGRKQMKIDSLGLRKNASTETVINSISQKLVERYQFAPVYLNDVELLYKDGYTIEVGDIIPFGGDDVQFIDFKTGKRGSDPALFEVINKSLNVKDGKIKLNLSHLPGNG